MRSPALGLSFCLVSLGVFGSLVGCKSHGESAGKKGSGESAVASGGSAVGQSAGGATSAPPSSAEPRVQLPEGPVLAIQAGKGVGPIRIGATVATIERLMEAPCEVKTAEVCRYIRRAVEFQLDKEGVTNRIVVQRHDRPAGLDAQGKPQVYGFFNGGIPPGVGLGMIPKAVLEILGPPLSSVRVTEKNAFNTIDRDTYPGGMELEYDEYTNGRVMLGAVIITNPRSNARR